MSEYMIDITNLNKAEVLRALYNNSITLGLGFLHFKNEEMYKSEAEQIINEHGENNLDFGYIYGRVMKVDLSNNFLDPRLYDRDNGAGAAKKVIDNLRNNLKE
jgi:hypothetical protein